LYKTSKKLQKLIKKKGILHISKRFFNVKKTIEKKGEEYGEN